ncbi:origin recognition complex subunit 5-like [Strongylocentrotus purpuratus]|uniref:Origin recognition complex subunit 5 n=1 Tax=Strongylocentrotus purpuratus TaxID=7668 RepID=A0A7M7PKL5_STRPU|nr:origin recognition complex subunit 5-like [Strongylocentrotus purpuratus]
MAPRRKAKSVDAKVLANELEEQLPCRGKQIALLLSLAGQPNHATCPAIFVYGHSATGKSAVVHSILESYSAPRAIVNCVEWQSQKQLFEEILNQVAEAGPSPENGFTQYARCDNANDFVRLLKGVVQEKGIEETVYIVLDKAERLRFMEGHILPAFLRLSELSECNVCVIMLSQIVWEKFRCGTGYCEPVIIHFPDYTKNEILEIIASDPPAGFKCTFYASYLNLLLSIFYMACRDLNEIRHLAQLNFQKYIEPITKGEATVDDAHKLWRNIEPHLKKALQTIYLREVSSSQWEKYQQEVSSHASLPTMLSARAHVELPFYSKFLLIAAYLASYNPARTDRRFFSKHHGKIKKSAKVSKKEVIAEFLLGPKAFPLDRLMAIFYSVVDARVAPSANIFSQISSLVTLQLLSHVGHDDQLDVPKYKCTVSLDFIRSIARTVNFDIIRYLYDFV